MRLLILFFLLSINSICFGQKNEKISTVDFVQILNDNKEETIFYYQNNWKAMRVKALERGYIDSFQLLETSTSEDAPFQIMLITTYGNKAQFDLREDHFAELIEEKGGLKLLNEKQPGEFRKIIFNKSPVTHLE